MDAAFRIDIRPEERCLTQTENTHLILQQKDECKKEGFNKSYERKSSKELKTAKERSSSLLQSWYTSVRFANIANIFLLSGCFSCVIYVVSYYKWTEHQQGLVGRYYYDQNTCNKNNQTCQTLPWTVQYEESSSISYSTDTRKINLLKPGSYVISLQLSIQNNNAGVNSKKKTEKHIRLACIRSIAHEKCGRFDMASGQNDILYVVKVHNKSQQIWVILDSWRYIYRVETLNTLSIVKI